MEESGTIILWRLYHEGRISDEEARALLNIEYETGQSNVSRRKELRHTIVGKDFHGINAGPGRPATILCGQDLAGTLPLPDLVKSVRRYWEGKRPNSAEMGRLIAYLMYRGYIRQLPPDSIRAVATLVTKWTEIAGWRIDEIRRGKTNAENKTVDVFARERARFERIKGQVTAANT